MGVVNESVPRAGLKDRVREIAKVLADKNVMTLRACKFAVKRVPEMSWDDADDFLMAKLDQMRFHDAEKGREKGMRQFLDDKSYRPGLGNYDRDR
jgi:trans-feruloyl-CoA hydratase/vanillin synthase